MGPGPCDKLSLVYPKECLHMKFEFNWPSGFRGEDV